VLLHILNEPVSATHMRVCTVFTYFVFDCLLSENVCLFIFVSLQGVAKRPYYRIYNFCAHTYIRASHKMCSELLFS